MIQELFDPYFFAGSTEHFEHLFQYDITLDRSIWDYKIGWAPAEYNRGRLLEDWEVPDAQTIIGHLRQGIHYQNKAPGNGRELTSDDVVFHYDRVLGSGSGFTEPNPYFIGWAGALQKVTATDKYTVVFKFSKPSWTNLYTVMDQSTLNVIECPEAVKDDSIKDWHFACGTGPYILTDFMSGSSVTYTKNPEYWGFDERYPENRLPYIETRKTLVIPDSATQQAAFRTGKIDMLSGGGRGGITWQQGEALEKDMPDVQKTDIPGGGSAFNMKCDTAPFNDIKVRIALQMAVDLKAINDSIYGGRGDPTPCGLMHPMFTGWSTPYSEWPQELKDEYAYNPEKAKELLAEAGYPTGFATDIYLASSTNMDLPQVVKAYFHDIGVEMEIKTVDDATSHDFYVMKKYDALTSGSWVAFPRPPVMSVSDLQTHQPMNTTDHGDLHYDELAQNVIDATTEAEAKEAMKVCDMYVIEHHWGVVFFPVNSTTYWLPRLKGFAGEQGMAGWLYARLWVD
jgi:peptide/nickel transport system substrate-binding protein